MRAALMLMASMAVSGCSWSVTVGQARASFSAQHRVVKEEALRTRRQAQAARALVTRMNIFVDDNKAEPYPVLSQLASRMEMGAKAQRGRADTIRRLRGRLSKMGPKPHVIRRFEPGWTLYSTLRSDLKRIRVEAAEASRNFDAMNDRFQALKRSHKLRPIDTEGYGDKMGAAITRMDAMVADAASRLAALSAPPEGEQLDAAAQRRLDGANGELERMTETRAEARRVALRFRLETKAGPEAVMGPGMVTFDLFARLEGLEADLKGSLARVVSLLGEP